MSTDMTTNIAHTTATAHVGVSSSDLSLEVAIFAKTKTLSTVKAQQEAGKYIKME